MARVQGFEAEGWVTMLIAKPAVNEAEPSCAGNPNCAAAGITSGDCCLELGSEVSGPRLRSKRGRSYSVLL